MGKFNFPIPGRKKPTSPQSIDDRALSKAHKILGSTPINIDNPGYRERRSSSAVDVTAAVAAAAGVRHLRSVDAYADDNHHPGGRLAISEGEWDVDSNLPSPLPRFAPTGVDASAGAAGGRVGGHVKLLKKSQSSSAIRSRTTLQATPRYASTLATATSAQHDDDDDDDRLDDDDDHKYNRDNGNGIGNGYGRGRGRGRASTVTEDARAVVTAIVSAAAECPRARRRPAMLDFSNLRPCSRLSRNSYQSQSQPESAVSATFGNNSNGSSRYASTLPGRLGKRSSLKRRTKESLRSLLSDGSGSTSSGGVQREVYPDTGLSTLYNHYEHTSLLQIIKQGQGLDAEDAAQQQQQQRDQEHDAQDEAEWIEAQADQDLDWLHKPLRDPARASVRDRDRGKRATSKSPTKTEPSRLPNKPGKPGKPKARSLEEADFHNKSVLLLSDSEDETATANALEEEEEEEEEEDNDDEDYEDQEEAVEEEEANANAEDNFTLLNRTYSGGPRRSRARASFTRSEESVRDGPRSGRYAERQPPSRKSRSSHHYTDNFKYNNNNNNNNNNKNHSPEGSPALYDPRSPSVRGSSLSSRDSKASVMTCQFGFGAQDLLTMTMLPARCPSQAELDLEAARIRASEGGVGVAIGGGGGGMPRCEPVGRSPEQLTPPLSPSSFNFYMRSSLPAVDSMEQPSRIMAVTREEKMLISALRRKNQALRNTARAEAHARLLGQAGAPAQPLAPLPTAQHEHDGSGSGSSKHASQELAGYGFDFPAPPKVVDRRALPSPILANINIQGLSPGDDDRFRHLSFDCPEEASSPRDGQGTYQDVLVFLDQRKASAIGPSGTVAAQQQQQQQQQPERGAASGPDFRPILWEHAGDEGLAGSRFHPGRIQTDNLAELERETQAGQQGRHETPISPESFPSVPENRVRSRNKARLSAVGYASPLGTQEPHWGDDD